MSKQLVFQVLSMKPAWDNTAQFAVLVVLADYYREDRGWAWPPRHRIATKLKLTPRRVHQIITELESLQLLVRLGPETGGKPNRYRLTLDPSERMKQISWSKDEAGFIVSEGIPVERGGSGLHGRMKPVSSKDEVGFMVRMKPVSSDPLIDPLKIHLGTGTATAQPRLPTPQGVQLPEKKSPKIPPAAATRRRLASEPGKNRNYDVLRKLAHALLKNPTAAKQYLKVPIRNEGDLLECVKRAAARNVVKYGLTTTDGQGVVHAAVKAAWFHFTNPKVIRGQAPRPRDVKRVRR